MTRESDGKNNAGCVRGGRFKENLRFWRRRRGLYVKEAAYKLGVAKSAWSQWETGSRSPSVESLNLIAETLSLPSCCFLSGDVARCEQCRASAGQSRSGAVHGA